MAPPRPRASAAAARPRGARPASIDAPVAMRQLRDEERLVGDRDPGRAVEYDAEHRRPGAAHAEDEERRPRHAPSGSVTSDLGSIREAPDGDVHRVRPRCLGSAQDEELVGGAAALAGEEPAVRVGVRVDTRTPKRCPATTSIRSRANSTYRTRTAIARVRRGPVPRAIERAQSQLVHAGAHRPPVHLPEPGEAASARAEAPEHAAPSVDEQHRPRDLVHLVGRRDPVELPSPSGENTRGKTSVKRRRGGVVSTRIGFGRTIVRPCSAIRTRGRYLASGTTRPASSRPSHVYETRPLGSSRSRTSVRTTSPGRVEHVDRHLARLPEHERDHRNVTGAHSQTGENSRSTRVPGDGAPLELQPLRDREGRRSRAEEREDDQRLRQSGQPLVRVTTVEPTYEDERLRVLPPAARAMVRRSRANRPLAARVWKLPPLGLVVGEGRDLALDRLAHVDVPVGTNQFTAAGVHSVLDVGAYVRRRSDGLPRRRPRRHRDGVEEHADGRDSRRAAPCRRPRRAWSRTCCSTTLVHLDVRERVQAHVRQMRGGRSPRSPSSAAARRASSSLRARVARRPGTGSSSRR